MPLTSLPLAPLLAEASRPVLAFAGRARVDRGSTHPHEIISRSAGCSPCGFDAFGGAANIIVILADDLGYSDLGCYGGEIATPNLDALAAGGLRFTQAYNTARCWPSRAAAMTGYYAQQVRRDILPGIASGGGNRGIRPAWAPLLTEFLRPAGYRNYHSGKWHIDGRPLGNAFDHSFEIGGGQSNFFKASGNTDDGVPNVQTPDYYVTTATADHSVKYLQEHAAKFGAQPFFHYLCFTAPHFPLHAPAADIAKYRDTYGQGWNAIAEARYARQKKSGSSPTRSPRWSARSARRMRFLTTSRSWDPTR